MKLELINKSFGNKKLFENFCLDIPQGAVVLITGPSGCGKTTLLNMISGLEKPDGGKLYDIGTVSYLFQEPRLLMWKTVLENVSLVSDESTALKYLKLVGLDNELKAFPNELSGGQRQRVSLARALAFRSDTILLDEPFQNLDRDLHNRLVSDFLEINEREKRTVVWVSHDSEEETVIRNTVHNYIKVSL